MPELFNVLPPAAAYATFLAQFRPWTEWEDVDTESALDRVTAAEVVSPADLPAFTRATMDGYSVRAADTYGATESAPAYLRVAGEVPMGAAEPVAIGSAGAAV